MCKIALLCSIYRILSYVICLFNILFSKPILTIDDSCDLSPRIGSFLPCAPLNSCPWTVPECTDKLLQIEHFISYDNPNISTHIRQDKLKLLFCPPIQNSEVSSGMDFFFLISQVSQHFLFPAEKDGRPLYPHCWKYGNQVVSSIEVSRFKCMQHALSCKILVLILYLNILVLA